MTVETSTRKETFSGGQAALTFSFRTLVSNPEYIKVKIVNTSTDVETDLTYSTDFTVSVNSDGVGGTVTVSPTYSTAYNYVVYRETAAQQEDDYDDYNQFPANTLENSLDRAIMIAQEQAEETDRTLRYPISATAASVELPVPEADAFLGWNSAGTALENKGLPDPSTLVKASSAVAEAGSNDTDYMTALKVKQEVQKAGLLAIPDTNLSQIATAGKTHGSSITGLASLPVGAGVIPIANLASGTPTGSKFVRDDNTLQTISLRQLTTPVTKSLNTIYQAEDDGFIYFDASFGSGTPPYNLSLVSDASTPPTIRRVIIGGTDAGGQIWYAACAPVIKGHYYRIVPSVAVSTTDGIFWTYFA